MAYNIFEYMEEIHISQTWTELEERFGFPLKIWKKEFEVYADKQPRSKSIMSVFMTFGHDHINLVLNSILLRNSLHPTFNNLVEYVIKKSASYDGAIKKQQEQRSRYKNG